MTVERLRPFQKKVNVVVKVVEKRPVREVTSRLDDTPHKVAEAVVGDHTGIVLLTLWDEDIDKVEVGKTYAVENGYTSLFKNSLRLNVGRYGKLTESDQEIATVNTENDLSKKEFASGPRF